MPSSPSLAASSPQRELTFSAIQAQSLLGLSTTCHLRLSAHVGEIVGKAVVGAGVVGESVGPGVGFAVGDGVGSGATRDGLGVGSSVGSYGLTVG